MTDVSLGDVDRSFATSLSGYRDTRRGQDEHVTTVKIAGRPVKFRTTSPDLAAILEPPFAHLPNTNADPELTICSWETPTGRSLAPELLREPAVYFHPGQGTSVDQLSQSCLETYAPRHRLAMRWVRTAGQTPPYMRAAPARRILSWWLARQGLLCLHAAAVGTENGVALIVGDSGRGKSTTALTCLAAGLTYLGDDFVAIEDTGHPVAHSLFSMARMTPTARKWLPDIAEAALGHPDNEGKDLVDLNAVAKGKIRIALPVQAILVPSFSGERHSATTPMPSGAAFQTMTRATMMLATLPPAALGPQLRLMAELTRQVPCYELKLGSELSGIAPAVLAALEEARR